ncbi:MAG: hypothetical protein AAGA53_17395 [Pseudomonadota bacterium]
MSNLVRLSRLMPLAVFLTMSLMIQALVVTQHGHAAHGGHQDAYQSVIICADGELKEILVDAHGLPVEHGEAGSSCPMCLAAGKLFLQSAELPSLRAYFAQGQKLLPQNAYHGPRSRQPDRLSCLDPPTFI